jgi:hypothetical protein
VSQVTAQCVRGFYTSGKKGAAMRFAAVVVPPKPSQRAPAAELLRRLVAGEPLLRAPSTQPQPAPKDLPADLDQRVRLVGEW